MKKMIRSIGLLVCITLTAAFANAQTVAKHYVPTPIAHKPVVTEFGQMGSQRVDGNSSLPLDPLSTLVAIPNSTFTNIAGAFDLQTNGRGLHNIIVDPSNPNNIHFCAMTATSLAASDTVSSGYPSRRVVYSFSSDGGKTWTSPKIVSGSIRTGYPDMILQKRGANYVPIIAAHRYVSGSSSEFESCIFIEQGNPGDGNFKEFDCDRTASDGGAKDLLWPCIALSNSGDSLYIIADFSNQSNSALMDYMEFGTFSMSTDGKTATWNGWTAEPGKGDGSAVQGYSSAGQHAIKVASDGRIGVSWINPDAGDGDHALYFVESKDGGKTWPKSVNPLVAPFIDFDNSRAIDPNYGIDFFYTGTTPHFVWAADVENYNETDSNGYYFPYTGQIFYWDPTQKSVHCLNFNDNPVYQMDSLFVLTDSVAVTYDYQNTNFTAANVTFKIDFPHFACVALPTFGLTSNPKVYSIYYEAISDNDTGVVIGRDDTTRYAWYSEIYTQLTTDGGHTWTEPTPYKSNTVESSQLLDYRYPQTSWNPVPTGIPIAYQADSIAGLFNTDINHDNGGGYDINYWFFTTNSLNSVKGGNTVTANGMLGQNYPNPVMGQTTIPVIVTTATQGTIEIVDVLGRVVRTVFSGYLSEGLHQISAETSSLSPGVYLYRLVTQTETDARLMTVTR